MRDLYPPALALAAGAVGLDWWGNSLRLALSLTLVFASAGIGFWLARLRVARHTRKRLTPPWRHCRSLGKWSIGRGA